MTKILNKYINGDYEFTIYTDGTLIRESSVENPVVIHPSSIDVKITDFCNMGCQFCHESSTEKGVHGDLNKLLEVLSVLPAGVEIANGGGNPLSHPDLVHFLRVIKERGLIANITVNQGHLKIYQNLIISLIEDDLIKGLGISINSNNFTYVKPLLDLTNNVVFHLIAGVNNINVIEKLISIGPYCKILVLGYKQFGFGASFYNEGIEHNIKEWYRWLPKYLGKCVLSFDNLAIEQLNIKRLFTQEGWDKFYMGDDFMFTMYIDAVKQEFAPTSRSNDRKSFKETTLLEFFKK